jgi:hypothetical protein
MPALREAGRHGRCITLWPDYYGYEKIVAVIFDVMSVQEGVRQGWLLRTA